MLEHAMQAAVGKKVINNATPFFISCSTKGYTWNDGISSNIAVTIMEGTK